MINFQNLIAPDVAKQYQLIDGVFCKKQSRVNNIFRVISFTAFNHLIFVCDALHDLVAFAQFKITLNLSLFYIFEQG